MVTDKNCPGRIIPLPDLGYQVGYPGIVTYLILPTSGFLLPGQGHNPVKVICQILIRAFSVSHQIAAEFIADGVTDDKTIVAAGLDRAFSPGEDVLPIFTVAGIITILLILLDIQHHYKTHGLFLAQILFGKEGMVEDFSRNV